MISLNRYKKENRKNVTNSSKGIVKNKMLLITSEVKIALLKY